MLRIKLDKYRIRIGARALICRDLYDRVWMEKVGLPYTGWINAHLSIIRDRPNQMEQTKRTKLKIYVEILLALEIDIDYKKKS